MSYIAKQHLAHDQFGFMVQHVETGRWLGGVGANYYRSWVYPLYTARGLTVLQEFPFDHPFHNGLWVAQGPIYFEGQTVHFWPMPPERRPGEPLFAHMGRIETLGLPTVESHDRGVRFTLQSVWRTANGTPVLDETRTVDLYTLDDEQNDDAPDSVTVCDVTTVQNASYGALEYEASKFGAICIRVDPRLTTVAGAEVIANGGRRGKAEVALAKPNTYVAYESGSSGGFGILLAVPGERPHEWFIRDYGLATYNPMFEQPRLLAQGESLRVNLRVVAYDNPLTDARAERWIAK
jgi:hypothetical protein